MTHRSIAVALLTALLAVGLAGTAGALDPGAQVAQETNDTDANATVDVGVGQQLSTVLATTSHDVRADYEERAFEYEYEGSAESERAAVVAERARTVAERARAVDRAYENATAAYGNGSVTRDEYAQRVATLNDRAERIRDDAAAIDRRTANISEAELEASGLNRTEFERSVADLEDLSGPGQRALLQQFTGERDVEVELRTGNGLELEVEGEAGERSREVKRARDDSTAMTVAQTDAAATARATLSTVDGEWTLVEASVHEESGYYEFEYALDAENHTGEAEVRVDGSSGEVYRIEEEIEAEDERDEDDEREREDDEREDDDRDADERDDDDAERDEDASAEGDLSLELVAGTPSPNEVVTVRATRDGDPVANATVELDGSVVGTTNADGEVTLRLPADEAEIRVDDGDDDGELEYEFDAEATVSVDAESDDETEDDATETEDQTETEEAS